MLITYDDGIAEGEECPECGGDRTLFDRAFGFWKCEDCSTVWGHDRDDPDYQDGDLNLLMPRDQDSAIAELKRLTTGETFIEKAIRLDAEDDDRTLGLAALKAKYVDELEKPVTPNDAAYDDIPF